ncbi:hypothetical protein B0H19DRAFT_1262115 [Mycena capillaripes]|nr:hypothetical protein B0H19DRAFT_1262115 [Mycena capillaripes]
MTTLNLLDLPPELIVACLVHLSSTDVESCLNCRNRLFREIILNSVQIQYLRELEHAGVEEGVPVSNSVVSDRLDALRRRESNWLNFTPTSRHIIPIDFPTTGVYDLASDIYLVGDTGGDANALPYTAIKYIHTSPESTSQEWRRIDVEKPIADFGTALEEHDLIAFVTYMLHDENPKMASIEVQLRQFSTGAHHPRAAQTTLHIQDVDREHGRPVFSIEILGETLALSMMFWSYERRDLDGLHLYNWKSGVLRMTPFTVYNTGLVFLSPEILLVPNSIAETLEVFVIPPTSEEGTAPYLTHSFHLPQLQDENSILSFRCRGAPNPRAFTSHPSGLKFSPDSVDAVLLFIFEVSRGSGSTTHIFVLDRALFSAVLESHSDVGEDVHWAAWGPQCTRWVDAGPIAMHYITVACGQRMVSIPQQAWRDPAPIRILDFNRHRVDAQRRLLGVGSVGPVEREHATVRVVDDATAADWAAHRDTFEDAVVSRLPYLEIISKEEFDFDAVLVNDENILGARFGDRRLESLEVLHFG